MHQAETARSTPAGEPGSLERGKTEGDYDERALGTKPFALQEPDLEGRSGYTLQQMHDTLQAIPAREPREIMIAGLAMHREFDGAEAAYGAFAHWAEQHWAYKDGVAADLWSNAGIVDHAPYSAHDIFAIARNYTDLESVEVEISGADEHGARAFNRAPDMAAGAIGSAANYVADQLGEFFAPSTPAEIAARGREAEIAAEIAAERKQVFDDLFVKYANQAIRRAEDERVREERDEEYWQSRERQRDR
jgi:hypothetical protein